VLCWRDEYAVGFVEVHGLNRVGSIVEFACGEMIVDLWRTSQLVFTWSSEWCTMKIWYVLVTVCNMCVEEMFCGLQIYFNKSQWRCNVDRCCFSGKRVRRHGGCKVQMFDLWLLSMFGGFALWVAAWFWRRVNNVYAQALANIYVRCVVIIHEHWLALMYDAWKFLGWLNLEWKFFEWFDSKWKFLGWFNSKWKFLG